MKRSIVTALATLSLVAFTDAPGRPAADFHLHLEKSYPAADATVAEVHEIRLWFSEAPDAGATRIFLVDAQENVVKTEPVEGTEDGGKSVAVSVPGPLPVGRYTATWRAMSSDGHAVTGDIPFSVTAASTR